MAASNKSLEKVKKLAEERQHDSDAQQDWDKLVKAYDKENYTRTPPDPKGAELKSLIAKLADLLDKRKEKKDHESGCPDDAPCGEKIKEINLEILAEIVFQRLIFEVRIERERTGWAG